MKLKLILLITLFVSIDASTYGQQNSNLLNGIAIDGYDAISYFNGHQAKGKSSIKASYLDAIYYFNSVSNKDRFLANPSKYAPQYGGWCAYAMGNDGTKVEIDPATYKIANGKLYLFYNAYFTNTKTKWDLDEVKLKNSADNYWEKYKTK